MAEEKKVTIKLQRLNDKSLKEYVEAVADPAGKPENGSAAALVAALAASLGALAASSAEEGKIDPVVLQELPEMSKYMLKQVEEMVTTALTDIQRQIIRRHEYEGVTLEKIAEDLGMQPPAVRMQLSRARKTIREQYRKRYHEE